MSFRYVTQDAVLSETTKVKARWSLQSDEGVKIYKKRWLMLGVFVLCAIANAMHWLQYSIISRTAEEYYGVSSLVIACTAMMYSVTFIISVFPGIWVLERVGLKIILITGDVLMIIGSWMKVASVEPELFYCGFIGQIIVGIAQFAVVSVPSYLAGLWFPADEVSTACAVGVLGTQIGVAISLFVPPQVVTKSNDMQQTRTQFFWLYVSFAVLPTLILPLIVFVFKNVPPEPPSYARLEYLIKQKVKKLGKPKKMTKATKDLLIALFSNTNFLILLISYSFIASTNNCISTLLDLIFDYHFKEKERAGIIGTSIVVISIFGCFFFGWILDKTHKFKLVSVIAYCFSVAGFIVFWVSLYLNEYHLLFFSTILIGFFLQSYVIIAVEFSSELTYPISETISTSILLSSGELLSIIQIVMSTLLFESYGEITVIYTTAAFMATGWFATLFLSTKGTLKRFEASFSHTPPPKISELSGRYTNGQDQPQLAHVKDQAALEGRIKSLSPKEPKEKKSLSFPMDKNSPSKRSSHSTIQAKTPLKDEPETTPNDETKMPTKENKI